MDLAGEALEFFLGESLGGLVDLEVELVGFCPDGEGAEVLHEGVIS